MTHARVTYIHTVSTVYSSLLKENSCNMLVSNHVNSDHIPFILCLDVYNVRQTTSDGYVIAVTTSTYQLVVDEVDYR